MSYRTYVEGVQLFGNNECYNEWLDFIRSQGIKINDEGCYEGEIKDFMGMLQVVEQITLNIEKKRMERKAKLEKEIESLSEEEQKLVRSHTFGIKSIFDLTNIPEALKENDLNDKFRPSLFDELLEYIRSGYAFMPYMLYLACKDKLEKDKPFSTDGHFECYKLKEGETIHVRAS